MDAKILANELDDSLPESIRRGPGGVIMGGRYKLVRLIAQGATGRVYEATDEQHPSGGRDARVALKVLHAHVRDEPETLMRFRHEALAMKSIDQRNVIRCIDADVECGVPYLVMEYVDGPTLRDFVRENGPLPLDEALLVFWHAARGLSGIHQAGHVHRDSKAANLLLRLSRKGRPYDATWTDFGHARVAGRRITREGIALGTAAYMAPEQVLGDTVDARTDVYALAILMFFTLTGELPYASELPDAVDHHLWSAAPPPSWIVDGLPEHIDRLVLTGLRKNPASRYPNAMAIVDDVERALGLGDEQPVSIVPLAVDPDTYVPETEAGRGMLAQLEIKRKR